MHISAVIVSIDYSDLLRETLPLNRAQLDEVVVVTSAEDSDSIRAAREHSASVCLSTKARFHGADFNRGALLNDGFRALHDPDWILVLDADIVLDPRFRASCREVATDGEGTIYWARRLQCDDFASWVALRDDWSRFADAGDVVAAPGYLQLFHGSAARLSRDRTWYPEYFPSAAGSDLWFRDLWPAQTALPHAVLHLGEPWVNWRGRRSPRFGYHA